MIEFIANFKMVEVSKPDPERGESLMNSNISNIMRDGRLLIIHINYRIDPI